MIGRISNQLKATGHPKIGKLTANRRNAHAM